MMHLVGLIHGTAVCGDGAGEQVSNRIDQVTCPRCIQVYRTSNPPVVETSTINKDEFDIMIVDALTKCGQMFTQRLALGPDLSFYLWRALQEKGVVPK